jgi:hypothetical protein
MILVGLDPKEHQRKIKLSSLALSIPMIHQLRRNEHEILSRSLTDGFLTLWKHFSEQELSINFTCIVLYSSSVLFALAEVACSKRWSSLHVQLMMIWSSFTLQFRQLSTRNEWSTSLNRLDAYFCDVFLGFNPHFHCDDLEYNELNGKEIIDHWEPNTTPEDLPALRDWLLLWSKIKSDVLDHPSLANVRWPASHFSRIC